MKTNAPLKRKRNYKSVAENCKVLTDLEKGISNKWVTEKYGVPRNKVSTWMTNKEKLLASL